MHEDVAAESEVASTVGMERRKHANRRVELLAAQLAQERAHRAKVTGCERVETPEDLPSALDLAAKVRRCIARRGAAVR